MESLKRSLKIGAGLAVLVAVCLVALPERPTLLAGAVTSAEGVSDARDPDLLVDANMPSASPAPDEPVQVAQADETAEGAAAPSAGQLHLQRLRERNAAPSPAPTPQQQQTPAPAVPATPAPSAGGGQGLDSLARPAAPPQFRLIRSAEAVDSTTIRDGAQSIPVAGIMPFAAGERCADGSCAEEARRALGEWLSGQETVCAVSPGAPAPCVRGEEDVAEWLVSNGWAEAEPGSLYEAAQDEARDAGRGLWGAGRR